MIFPEIFYSTFFLILKFYFFFQIKLFLKLRKISEIQNQY